jgi:hypothetical protein
MPKGFHRMNEYLLPREVVDAQLRAYNAHDLEAFCATYAHDAVLSKPAVNQELARGMEAIRALYAKLFSNSKIHCEIKSRIEISNFVIDHERITGRTDGLLEAVAIYEVRDSLIRSVLFVGS